MSKQREALQLALEALTEVTGWQWAGPMRVMDEVEDAIAAIRKALAEPARKPLTDEEIERLLFESHHKPGNHRHNFARLIERAHGITQPTEENT